VTVRMNDENTMLRFYTWCLLSSAVRLLGPHVEIDILFAIFHVITQIKIN